MDCNCLQFLCAILGPFALLLLSLSCGPRKQAGSVYLLGHSEQPHTCAHGSPLLEVDDILLQTSYESALHATSAAEGPSNGTLQQAFLSLQLRLHGPQLLNC
jgi:hypothetical protein